MNLYNFEVLQISASNYKYFQKVLIRNSFRIESTSFTMLRSVTNILYILYNVVLTLSVIKLSNPDYI